MSGKLVFLAAFLGAGGYFGYKMATYDESVVPYSKAQVQEMLASAKRSIPRKTNDGYITMWSNGKTGDGVKLAMRYDDTAPQIDCLARITELGPNESQVYADCGSSGTGSAIGQTTVALNAPMFDEHIQATLRGREFDRSRADGKQTAVVMKNMGAMQREALGSADQMQRMEAEMESGASDSGDYGSEGGE
jgi:hypothetical protein